jgi:hypothetical protein
MAVVVVVAQTEALHRLALAALAAVVMAEIILRGYPVRQTWAAVGAAAQNPVMQAGQAAAVS